MLYFVLQVLANFFDQYFKFKCFIKIFQPMESHQYIYSTPIEGTKQPGASHIYRHPQYMKQLILTPTPGITNLKDLFLDIFLNQYPNRRFLGKIHIQSVEQNGVMIEKRSITNILTYKEGFKIAQKIGTALIKSKLIHEQNEALRMIAVYSRNRQELYLADLAFLLYGITCVPLYDTLGVNNLDYCLDNSQVSTCICSTSNAKTLLALPKTSNLKNIILCDPVQESLLEQLKKRFTVYDFWRFLEQVKEEDIISHQLFKIQPNQCYTFSYTSGTTGPPKAAMLSHHNLLSFIAGHKINKQFIGRNGQDECHLSILPLPHVFQRIIVFYEIYIGSFIVPTSGNPLKIKDQIALVKPTQLIVVPRLFNRIIQSLYDTFGGEENLRKLIEADSPILNKVRQGFGGRIKFMLSGSAPINPKILEILGNIMKCPFIEAYGQTQNTGGAFIQDYKNKLFDGNIGHVWPSLQFKLVDIPEMGYTSDDKDADGNLTPRGQIWLRGYGVILGYYKMPEVTKETITADGWLKTGDVGALSPITNNMKLIDRKKNIFKLSQGEYVSSQKVEFYYLKSKYVVEAFLYGDSLKDYPVCIIAPNRVELEKLSKELNIEKSYAELCEDKDIIKHVLKDLKQKGIQGKLNSFEQAKNIRFQPESFAVRGIVSSTMKLQRFQAKNYYKKRFQEMYEEGDLTKE